jgi:hypothetical protein
MTYSRLTISWSIILAALPCRVAGVLLVLITEGYGVHIEHSLISQTEYILHTLTVGKGVVASWQSLFNAALHRLAVSSNTNIDNIASIFGKGDNVRSWVLYVVCFSRKLTRNIMTNKYNIRLHVVFILHDRHESVLTGIMDHILPALLAEHRRGIVIR